MTEEQKHANAIQRMTDLEDAAKQQVAAKLVSLSGAVANADNPDENLTRKNLLDVRTMLEWSDGLFSSAALAIEAEDCRTALQGGLSIDSTLQHVTDEIVRRGSCVPSSSSVSSNRIQSGQVSALIRIMDALNRSKSGLRF